MIITSSTTLRNDYAKISAMAHSSDEMIRLKTHLDLVEESRIAGNADISVEEARNRLMEKYRNAGI